MQLGHEGDVNASLVSGNRRPHSRKPGTDHDDVVCAHFSRTSGWLRGFPLSVQASAAMASGTRRNAPHYGSIGPCLKGLLTVVPYGE